MGRTLLHGELTNEILNAFYHVYNTLGYGFLEHVYERSLKLTLEKRRMKAPDQVPIAVFFEGHQVGECFADLVVDGLIIVELKAAESICPAHEAQLINYLRAIPMEVGLLINFSHKPEFKRKVFMNDRKRLPVRKPS